MFQINLEVLVFKERGKPENLEKNLSEQRREPTTNLTQHMALTPRFEPGPLRWEASALTTTPATLAFLETRTFPQVDFVTRWPNHNGLLWKPWWNRRGYYLLALIAYVYVNDPSVDERNKRASSKKAIEWASEKKGIKTAAFILLIKGLICLQNCSRLSACGPRAARI